MRIAFTTELPAEGFVRLNEHELYAPLEAAEVLVSTFDKAVTRDMITAAPNLQLVANFGVGFNNVDIEACRERGIRVTNTPQPVIDDGHACCQCSARKGLPDASHAYDAECLSVERVTEIIHYAKGL